MTTGQVTVATWFPPGAGEPARRTMSHIRREPGSTASRWTPWSAGRVLRNPLLARGPIANYLVSRRKADRCPRFSAFS